MWCCLRLNKHYFGPGREAIDYYHRQIKIVPDLLKLAKQVSPMVTLGELNTLGAQLSVQWVRICTKEKKENRVLAWMNLRNTLTMHGIPKGRQLLDAFLQSYKKYMEKCATVDHCMTGYNESLHSHNLWFWSKYVYQPRLNYIKQLFSHLSWNYVPQWASGIRAEVLTLL